MPFPIALVLSDHPEEAAFVAALHEGHPLVESVQGDCNLMKSSHASAAGQAAGFRNAFNVSNPTDCSSDDIQRGVVTEKDAVQLSVKAIAEE